MLLGKYKIFGFNVLSELPLDAEEVEFEKPEITISFGNIDLHESVYRFENSLYTYLPDGIQVLSPKVAAFFLQDGDKIIIDRFKDGTDELIQIALLGFVFGLLMFQRKEFPLHGSTVAVEGGCFTFVGHPCAGKSSIAAGFLKRGFKLLADDTTRIKAGNNECMAYHSFPSRKICKDTAEKIGIAYDSKATEIPWVEKYIITDYEAFETSPQKLTAIIEITKGDVESPILVELTGAEKLDLLVTHTYAQFSMDNVLDLGAHLKHSAQVAQKTKVIKLVRPNTGFTVEQQIDTILAYFNI